MTYDEDVEDNRQDGRAEVTVDADIDIDGQQDLDGSVDGDNDSVAGAGRGLDTIYGQWFSEINRL